MRTPGSTTLPCEICGGTDVAADQDFVCTFTQDGHDAVVYLHASATRINETFFPTPVYETVAAFIAEDDVVTPLADAAYDAGGNHRNDFFSFTLNDVRYTYNHSSFGFGFRVCQPVDCVVRETSDGVVTDGCQPERTAPEACIAVSAPLPELVDNFATCAGDPT
jgi:hypothetical protein